MQENEKIRDIIIGMERLKDQVSRLVSNAESEKGTLKRETERIYNEIESIEKKFDHLILNPETGLLLEVDRLKQDFKQRQSLKRNILALWVGVIGLALKYIAELFKK